MVGRPDLNGRPAPMPGGCSYLGDLGGVPATSGAEQEYC